MTLRDSCGEIQTGPGDYFKIGEAKLEIVCEKQDSRTVWCRVVEGLVAVDEGRKVGPGSIIDIDAREVIGHLRAYNDPVAIPEPARPQQPAQTEPKERRTRKSNQRAQNVQPITDNLF
jgi:hypothetical protein